MKYYIMFFVSVVAGIGLMCFAQYPAMVEKSGQSASFYPGDDGDLQIGTAWPTHVLRLDRMERLLTTQQA